MSHHAVLVRGPLDLEEALALYPEREGVEVFVVPYSEIGIDEVRSLTLEASLRPREGERRLLVVAVRTLTVEAQQALLKLLEEPPSSTSFLFVVPEGIALLPTLLSRFFTLSPEISGAVDVTAFAEFRASSLAERLDLITKRLAKKDAVWVEAMRLGLREYITTEGSQVGTEELRALSFVLTRLSTRGASNKLLLEELALSLKTGTGPTKGGTL